MAVFAVLQVAFQIVRLHVTSITCLVYYITFQFRDVYYISQQRLQIISIISPYGTMERIKAFKMVTKQVKIATKGRHRNAATWK